MKAAAISIVAALTVGACGGGDETRPVSAIASAADAERGRQLISDVGCGACHQIPGVRGPRGTVGPSLEGFASRSLVAGRFPNEPELVADWVRDAPALVPETGMPPMPLTENQAADVAAYLATLTDD